MRDRLFIFSCVRQYLSAMIRVVAQDRNRDSDSLVGTVLNGEGRAKSLLLYRVLQSRQSYIASMLVGICTFHSALMAKDIFDRSLLNE